MTGQSAVAAEPAVKQPRGRTDSSPEPALENVKSTFEDDRRQSTFRRPRGNSLIGKRAGTGDAPSMPPPPINTRALSPPRGYSPPGPKSAGAVPSQGAPSPALIKQQIESANAVLTIPVRKKAVDKDQIGTPTLVYTTSSFNTYDLPDHYHHSEPLRTPPSTASSSKSRKRTNTLFGRSESSDQAPDVPVLSRVDSGLSDTKSRKSYASNKLRKSTSDGGTLGSRARVNEASLMREQMPRFQHGPAGGMI